MFDLISVGVTFVDTYIPLIDAEIVQKDGRQFLSLPFGSKISVGSATSLIGGNAANNAVGSARLGLKTAIYTHVGNKDEDEWDNRIIAKFKKEEVDTRYVCETNKYPSGHNIVLDFKGERTILAHHQPWDYNLPDFENSRWVYLTSMAPTYLESNLSLQLINYIDRSGAKLVFQPGSIQLKIGAKKQNKLLVLSQVIIMNTEEAKVFLGLSINDKTSVRKLLTNLCNLGPKISVITDGINGSYGFDGENFYQMGIFPAKLVEMTGCGDAYATGLIAGIFYGESLPGAMRWGAANSASVCGQIGSQAGLLTLSQIREKLKTYFQIVAKAI